MSHTTLYLSQLLKNVCAGRDPVSWVKQLDGMVYRALEGRRTFRTEIGGRAYFVKIHTGVGWAEVVKNLISFRLPVLGARNEYEAITRLHEAAVPTMTVAGFAKRGFNPARQQSFLITDEIAPATSLEDYCRDWEKVPPKIAHKRALIDRVADMVGRMHRAGVNHRDLYICHFLLKQPSHFESLTTGVPDLYLIDLHRAQVRSATPLRWRNKDLAALYFSALHIGLTQRDFLRFLSGYFAVSAREVLRTHADLLTWLRREGVRLDARYLRKFAPKAA